MPHRTQMGKDVSALMARKKGREHGAGHPVQNTLGKNARTSE